MAASVATARAALRPGRPSHGTRAWRLAGAPAAPPLVGGAATPRRRSLLARQLHASLRGPVASGPPHGGHQPRRAARARRRGRARCGARRARAGRRGRGARRCLDDAAWACTRRFRPSPPGVPLGLQVLAGGPRRAALRRAGQARPAAGADLRAGGAGARTCRRRARRGEGAADRPFRRAEPQGAGRLDGARAAFRRRRFGADAHRRRDGHPGRRHLRAVGRARMGSVADRQPRRRLDHARVPSLRPRRLPGQQDQRMPDDPAGAAGLAACEKLLDR